MLEKFWGTHFIPEVRPIRAVDNYLQTFRLQDKDYAILFYFILFYKLIKFCVVEMLRLLK